MWNVQTSPQERLVSIIDKDYPLGLNYFFCSCLFLFFTVSLIPFNTKTPKNAICLFKYLLFFLK